MIEKILKRDGRIVPFDKRKIAFAVLRAAVAVGGRDKGRADYIADKVVELLENRSLSGTYPTVEEVQDCVEKVLIEEGHARTAKAYIVYRYEHSLKRAGRQSLTYSSDNIPYKKLWEALSWGVDHGCATLDGLCRLFQGESLAEFVGSCERFYEDELDGAVEKIEERLSELRVIIVAGPSSSGKTTTTEKLAARLAKHRRRFVPINVDNYFFDLTTHPEDVYGDYDFETPQALDIELLNDHLRRMLKGEEVEIPFYNFKAGKRDGSSGRIALKEGDIVLIDSLHGLYESMTEAVPREHKFKVYVETLAQVKDKDSRYIRWADIRMLRRMVRDKQFRNYNPWETLLHWHFVRRSELRYIVSRLSHADAVVNSYLPYELPLLKARLKDYFSEFLRKLEDQKDREDAFSRALRIKELFEQVPDFSDESIVPENSLLREFLGKRM